MNFEKILKVRNKLIKEKKTGEEIYKIYNEKFVEEGLKIVLNRREFIKKLSILLNLNYRKLFDENSELKLKYDCFLGDVEKKTREELKEKFENKSKEIKDNLNDFSEKVKVNAEAFTEDLTKFVLDLKNKFKN